MNCSRWTVPDEQRQSTDLSPILKQKSSKKVLKAALDFKPTSISKSEIDKSASL